MFQSIEVVSCLIDEVLGKKKRKRRLLPPPPPAVTAENHVKFVLKYLN